MQKEGVNSQLKNKGKVKKGEAAHTGNPAPQRKAAVETQPQKDAAGHPHKGNTKSTGMNCRKPQKALQTYTHQQEKEGTGPQAENKADHLEAPQQMKSAPGAILLNKTWTQEVMTWTHKK